MKSTLLRSFVLFLLFTTSITAQDTLELCTVLIDHGDTTEMQIKVKNFEDVTSFQFAMAWNANQYTYSSVGNFNEGIPGIGQFNFNYVMAAMPDSIDLLRTVWFDLNVSGVSLPDDEVLFSVYMTDADPDNIGLIGIFDDPDFPREVEVAVDGGNEVEIPIVDGEGCIPSWNLDDLISSISEIDEGNSIQILRNPIQQWLEIKTEEESLDQIKIYSLDGRQVYNVQGVDAHTRSFDLGGLSNGIYVVSFLNANAQIIDSQKIMVQK